MIYLVAGAQSAGKHTLLCHLETLGVCQVSLRQTEEPVLLSAVTALWTLNLSVDVSAYNQSAVVHCC